MVFGEKPAATQILKQGWCFEGPEPWQDIRLNSRVWTRDSQKHTEMSRHRGNPQVKIGEKKEFVLKQLKQSKSETCWPEMERLEQQDGFHQGTLHCPVFHQPAASRRAGARPEPGELLISIGEEITLVPRTRQTLLPNFNSHCLWHSCDI